MTLQNTCRWQKSVCDESSNVWPENEGLSTKSIKWKFKLLQLNWNLFIRRIVTGDETWLHDYDPETKQQTVQWKHASSPNPLKFKMQATAGNVHCFLGCWRYTADWLQHLNMPHKVTITGAYAGLLCKLLITSKEKRQGKLTQVPVVLHDNANVQSHFGQAAVLECTWMCARLCMPCLNKLGSKRFERPS